MKKFLDKDFLLSTKTSKKLYHKFASTMPIIDYHCHIDAKEVYEDKRFENITQIWLGGDHYKWRVMRSNGIDEKYITGDATDKEKFLKFAACLEKAIGNPMYHWCHLELKNYFGYNGVLSEKTAEEVWDLCNEKLSGDDFSARSLILKSNVKMIGTTDDPTSTLEWHKKIKQDPSFFVVVAPSFRPDPALNIHKDGFCEYIKKLSESVGFKISSFDDVKKALTDRIDYFDKNGCKASDHGLDYVMFSLSDDKELDKIFKKALNGKAVTTTEQECYQTALLLHCAAEYTKRDWAMQIHFSCMRNPNKKMFDTLGADSGFDCIAVTDSCNNLFSLMNELNKTDTLPKTILYSLNPADNQWIDTLIGAFQGPQIAGRIQHGSAWWFNDNKKGMFDQIESLANLSLLGNFVGMLTDSRSFLSYARHEYFRRILCEFIGNLVENGEYPDDIDVTGKIVCDISYNNAKKYFGL